jgi:WD40 repeat protein
MLKSLFSSDRPTTKEVLLTLHRNRQMARECTDVVVKCLKTLKGHAAFVRFAVQRILRATKVIQRLFKRFLLQHTALIGRGLEMWNQYELNNGYYEGDADRSPVDTEAKYFLLKAEFYRLRMIYRQKWHQWRKLVQGLEAQLEMSTQDSSSTMATVARDRANFLRIRLHQLKSREPKFSFNPDFRRLAEEVVVHLKKKNRDRVEKAVVSLGLRVADPDFVAALASQYEAIVEKQKRKVIRFDNSSSDPQSKRQSPTNKKAPSLYYSYYLRRMEKTLHRRKNNGSNKGEGLASPRNTSGKDGAPNESGDWKAYSPLGSLTVEKDGRPSGESPELLLSEHGVTETLVFDNDVVSPRTRRTISPSSARTCQKLGLSLSDLVEPLAFTPTKLAYDSGVGTEPVTTIDGGDQVRMSHTAPREVKLLPTPPKAIPQSTPQRTRAAFVGTMYPSLKYPEVRPPAKHPPAPPRHIPQRVHIEDGPLLSHAATLRIESVKDPRPRSATRTLPPPPLDPTAGPVYPYSRYYAREGAEERANLHAAEEAAHLRAGGNKRAVAQSAALTQRFPSGRKWSNGRKEFPTSVDVILSEVSQKSLSSFVHVPARSKDAVQEPVRKFEIPKNYVPGDGNSSNSSLATKKSQHSCIPVKPLKIFAGHTGMVTVVCILKPPQPQDLLSPAALASPAAIKKQSMAIGQSPISSQGPNSIQCGDGIKYVASGSFDGTVRVWSILTGECLHIEHHKDRVSQLVSTGCFLCTGSDDSSIHVLNAVSGTWECLSVFHHKTWVSSLYGYGNCLASGGLDSMVYVWDLAGRKRLHSFNSHVQPVSGFAADPEGKYLVSVSLDGNARVMQNAMTRRQLTSEEENALYSKRGLPGYTEHKGPIIAVAHLKETQFVTASRDSSVHVWDAVTLELRVLIFVNCERVESMTVMQPNLVLCCGADGSNRVFNTTTGSFLYEVTTKGVNATTKADPVFKRFLLGNSMGDTFLANGLAGTASHALSGPEQPVSCIDVCIDVTVSKAKSGATFELTDPSPSADDVRVLACVGSDDHRLYFYRLTDAMDLFHRSSLDRPLPGEV